MPPFRYSIHLCSYPHNTQPYRWMWPVFVLLYAFITFRIVIVTGNVHSGLCAQSLLFFDECSWGCRLDFDFMFINFYRRWRHVLLMRARFLVPPFFLLPSPSQTISSIDNEISAVVVKDVHVWYDRCEENTAHSRDLSASTYLEGFFFVVSKNWFFLKLSFVCTSKISGRKLTAISKRFVRTKRRKDRRGGMGNGRRWKCKTSSTASKNADVSICWRRECLLSVLSPSFFLLHPIHPYIFLLIFVEKGTSD